MSFDPRNDQRRFTRVPFSAQARVRTGTTFIECVLLDVSLKGVLLQRPASWTPQLGAAIALELVLADGVSIHMDAGVAHIEPERVGLTARYLDVDSATHLRRLIELNLGDESRLHRELSAMIAPR